MGRWSGGIEGRRQGGRELERDERREAGRQVGREEMDKLSRWPDAAGREQSTSSTGTP